MCHWWFWLWQRGICGHVCMHVCVWHFAGDHIWVDDPIDFKGHMRSAEVKHWKACNHIIWAVVQWIGHILGMYIANIDWMVPIDFDDGPRSYEANIGHTLKTLEIFFDEPYRFGRSSKVINEVKHWKPQPSYSWLFSYLVCMLPVLSRWSLSNLKKVQVHMRWTEAKP